MEEVVRAIVLADTHLGPRFPRRRLPSRLLSELGEARVILHAGDVTDAATLELLAEFAPVHAVLGNNDRGLRLPERISVRLGGCDVAMVHDSGPARGRASRLRRWFPDADVVVYGHSHVPEHHVDRRDDGHEQHQLNPGSPTERRRSPACTFAWLELAQGEVRDVRHVAVAAPSEELQSSDRLPMAVAR